MQGGWEVVMRREDKAGDRNAFPDSKRTYMPARSSVGTSQQRPAEEHPSWRIAEEQVAVLGLSRRLPTSRPSSAAVHSQQPAASVSGSGIWPVRVLLPSCCPHCPSLARTGVSQVLPLLTFLGIAQSRAPVESCRGSLCGWQQESHIWLRWARYTQEVPRRTCPEQQ